MKFTLGVEYAHWRGWQELVYGKVLGRPMRMYDTITPFEIPVGARAVAGYVGGRWPTYPLLAGRYRHVVSIAISATEDAHCLDIETGDAEPGQAYAWMTRQIKSGPPGFRPILYVQVSRAQMLVDELLAHGVQRPSYRLWTAHYSYRPHRCSSRCGFGFGGHADATQWTDRSQQRNLDESLLSPTFFHHR